MRSTFKLGILAALLFACSQAHAQGASAVTVAVCGNRSYTAGQVNPLTQDTTGKECTSAAASGTTTVQGTAASGAAATGNPVQVGGVDASGNARALSTDSTGRAITVQATTGTAGVTMLNAVTVTGASAAYNNGTSGYTAHDLQITTTGAPTYSINFEASLDNTNWVVLDQITSSSVTPNQIGSAGFYPYLRANLTSLSGGTLTALYSGATVESPQVSIVGQTAAKSGIQTQGVDVNGLAQNISVDSAGAASTKAVAIQGIANGVAIAATPPATLTAIADSTGNSEYIPTGNVAANPMASLSFPLLFNGSSWDRLRSIAGGGSAGTGVAAFSFNPTTSVNAAATKGKSTALEASHVIKASAGNLYWLTVTADANAGFLMIFDATSAPADGAVTPDYCVPIAASTGNPFNWLLNPMNFSTGITVVYSSTGCLTKTASIHATFYWGAL